MFISLTSMRKDLLLVNVYGPNRDSPEFYDKMEEHVSEMGLSDIIMGGHWNLVLNLNMDYCNYKHVNNPLAWVRVEDMILNLDLMDMWRDLNTECKRFTWRRPTPLQQSRLDFFSFLNPWFHMLSKQTCSMDTSQTILWLFWNFYLEKKKWNAFSKFNSSLLKDYAYLKEINEEIKHVVEEYVVMLYDRKEMHNIPIFNLQYPTSCFLMPY